MSPAQAFSSRLAELLRRERTSAAEFLVALSDFDQRRLWIELGYNSLFHFLTRELGMSKGAAHYRSTAAHLIERFPEVVAPLADGRLCITTIIELARVITPENRAEILPRFFHVSREVAKEVAAEIRPVPNPPQRVVVTALPAAGVGTLALVTPRSEVTVGSTVEPPHANTSKPVGAPAPRTEVQPLDSELSRLHVTVTRRLVKKLAAARDALSHSRPNATDDELLEAGLDLLIQRAAKRRGLVDKPRKEPPPSLGESVPAHIRREVWQRDGGCCTFPLANGGVCGSTRQLELDHVRPKALGPLAPPLTADAFRIRCRLHNVVEGRRKLGDAVMDRYTSLGRVRNAPAPG